MINLFHWTFVESSIDYHIAAAAADMMIMMMMMMIRGGGFHL